MKTSIFILPASLTTTSTKRVVVRNSIASRAIASRRGIYEQDGVTYRGKAVGKLRSSAWRRAWEVAALPLEPGILKGVHNLRHYSGSAIIPSWARVGGKNLLNFSTLIEEPE